MDKEIPTSKIQEMATFLKYENLEDGLLRIYDCGIKVIPMEYGGYERFDENNLLDFVKQLPSTIVKMAKNKKFNVGVELGRHSRNLFIVTFSSKADCDDIARTLCEYNQWITTDGSKYHIWLCLKDGIAEDCQTSKYKIQTQGTFLAPPSSHADGDICCWEKREGSHPPIIDKIEIKKIFPQLVIQATKVNRTQNLQIHIKKEEIRQAIACAFNISWPGRFGLSLLKIFIACCRRADLERIEDFRASLCETSLLAGVCKNTVRNAFKVLIEMKLLYPVETNSITDHYGINLDFFQGNMLSSQIAGMILPILNDDAFSRTALNPSGAQIYCSLLFNSHATLKDICRSTGRGYSTVKKAIKTLEKNDLVTRKNGHWFALPCNKDNLNIIAKNYGVAGKFQKKKATYSRQREKFVASQMWKALT